MSKKVKNRNERRKLKEQSSIKINWRKANKLSYKDRAEYFDSLIDEILRERLTDPVEVDIEGVIFVVNRKNAKVLKECMFAHDRVKDLIDIRNNTFTNRVKMLWKSIINMDDRHYLKDKGFYSYKLVRNTTVFTLGGVILLNSAMASLSDGKLKIFSGMDALERAREATNSNIVAQSTDVYNFKFDNGEEKAEAYAEYQAELLRYEAQQQEERRQAIYDSYIEEYCLYFNLDSAKVISLARSLTSNYTNSFKDIIGEFSYDVNSEEANCLMFVYQLQRDKLTMSLSELGLSKSALKISDGIYGNNRHKGEALVLRNGESGSEFLGRICDLIGADKYYLLSISYLETALFDSKMCRIKNNFGGMRSNGEFFTFSSPEAGIIAFCMNLNNYTRYNLKSLSELSGIYVNGNRSNPSLTWVSSVSSFHSQISQNPEKYFKTGEDLTDVKDYSLSLTPIK